MKERVAPVTGGDLEGLFQKALKYGAVEIRQAYYYPERVEVIVHRGQRNATYTEAASPVHGYGNSVSDALQHIFQSGYLDSVPMPQKPPT